jgi:isochorismate synthase EntC
VFGNELLKHIDVFDLLESGAILRNQVLYQQHVVALVQWIQQIRSADLFLVMITVAVGSEQVTDRHTHTHTEREREQESDNYLENKVDQLDDGTIDKIVLSAIFFKQLDHRIEKTLRGNVSIEILLSSSNKCSEESNSA